MGSCCGDGLMSTTVSLFSYNSMLEGKVVAAHHWVYGFGHLRADCRGPAGISSGTLCSFLV